VALELVQIITSARSEAKQRDEALRKARFRTHHSADGVTGMAEAKDLMPVLVLLDADVSGMSGEDVCRHLREDAHLSKIPLVLVGTDAEESDRARLLDLGADDYLLKPVGLRELVARIKSVLRRARPMLVESNQPIDLDLMLEGVWCGVSYCGHHCQLTTAEWALLQRLVRRSGKPVPQEELVGEIWGEDGLVHDRELDRAMKGLNQKLTDSGCPGDTISWLPSLGYTLKRPAA
jgi:DNA-binding response OmpR family regulator